MNPYNNMSLYYFVQALRFPISENKPKMFLKMMSLSICTVCMIENRQPRPLMSLLDLKLQICDSVLWL